MQESKNEFNIIGTLKTKNLREAKTKSGRDAIMGSLTVEVKEMGRVHNHRIELFTFKETNKGELNNVYTSYKTIMDEYKDMDHFGDEADFVSVNGSIDYNVYKGADGKVHENTRLRGRFANRVARDDNHVEQAIANVDMIVDDYEEELKNDEPTGLVKIKAYSAGYNNRGIKLINLKTKTSNNVHNVVPVGTTLETTLHLNNYAVVKEEEKEDGEALFGTMKKAVKTSSYVNNIEMVSAKMPSMQYTPEDLEVLKKSVREQSTEASARENNSGSAKVSDSKRDAINNALPF